MPRLRHLGHCKVPLSLSQSALRHFRFVGGSVVMVIAETDRSGHGILELDGNILVVTQCVVIISLLQTRIEGGCCWWFARRFFVKWM